MKTTTQSVLTTLTLGSLLAATLLAPIAVQAREAGSAKSVGGGIKCYNVVTTDNQGRVKVNQVCSKSV